VPLHVTDERLLGGLDLAATLQAGRPVVARGILAEADAGVVVLAMAERLEARAAARLGLVLDSREVRLERDGLARRLPTRFALVALDEGIAADERPPPALLDRLAFHLDLSGIGAAEPMEAFAGSAEIAAARRRRREVAVSASVTEALCAAALALGIDSIRAPLLALRVAVACAALAGRSEVAEEDAATAARLVLAPRAVSLPSSEAAPEEREPEDEETREPEDRSPGSEDDAEEPSPAPDDDSLAELVLSAAKAALPAGLLAQLRVQEGLRARGGGAGKAGVRRLSKLRGRPTGVRKGSPGSGARLDVVETLRAAAPWQRLRRSEAGLREAPVRRSARLQVRRDDFRIARFKERTETTVIFVVDASGSTALQRLAEAKGAVELLLAECYVRRDRVALIAFRGRAAELVLSPTRSLARAKRSLAGLPGGGGTPLATGIEAAERLTDAVVQRGGTPLVILLTDGRANVARDGSPGRTQAEQDALAAARRLRAASRTALVVDTSPRPQTAAQRLAQEMGALYLPLPQADSAALCEVVRGATGGSAQPARRAARSS
jgi:magnesium chelatase subunit D